MTGQFMLLATCFCAPGVPATSRPRHLGVTDCDEDRVVRPLFQTGHPTGQEASPHSRPQSWAGRNLPAAPFFCAVQNRGAIRAFFALARAAAASRPVIRRTSQFGRRDGTHHLSRLEHRKTADGPGTGCSQIRGARQQKLLPACAVRPRPRQ